MLLNREARLHARKDVVNRCHDVLPGHNSLQRHCAVQRSGLCCHISMHQQNQRLEELLRDAMSATRCGERTDRLGVGVKCTIAAFRPVSGMASEALILVRRASTSWVSRPRTPERAGRGGAGVATRYTGRSTRSPMGVGVIHAAWKRASGYCSSRVIASRSRDDGDRCLYRRDQTPLAPSLSVGHRVLSSGESVGRICRSRTIVIDGRRPSIKLVAPDEPYLTSQRSTGGMGRMSHSTGSF